MNSLLFIRRRSVYACLHMRIGALALGVLLLSAGRAAHADVIHVVQRGHTVEAIAHRYHVGVKAILDANHLKDSSRLKPGQTIVVPGAARTTPGAALAQPNEPPGRAGRRVCTSPAARSKPECNTVRAVRQGEEFRIRLKDEKGHVPAGALKSFERLMRQGDETHPPDARLVALVGVVSNHFEGRTIEVVSGYRAYTPTQYTPHSNHNIGRALDFRIQGVKNEDLRDFCLTLRHAGCGYYPNSTFVHIDVRDTKASWTDRSRPGEPPLYDRPGVMADEGTSDVPEEQREGPEEPRESPAGGTTPPGSSDTHAAPTEGDSQEQG
jgi:uncharacterized protein YcbK (DUF882 family)